MSFSWVGGGGEEPVENAEVNVLLNGYIVVIIIDDVKIKVVLF